MSWYASLRAEADPIWRAIHMHPFVRGLGDGTLPIDRFRFFLAQDYPYLREFGRVLGLAVSRGGTLEEMAYFAELLHGTLTFEMALHRGVCAELGITESELESTPLAPTAHAYTRHLLAIGALGTQAEMAVALLPCTAGYAEIGASLAGLPASGKPLYERWIRTYASNEYQRIAKRLIEMVDRLEGRLSAEDRARCRGHFLISSRYELLFWEMAYRLEEWA